MRESRTLGIAAAVLALGMASTMEAAGPPARGASRSSAKGTAPYEPKIPATDQDHERLRRAELKRARKAAKHHGR